MSFEPEYLKPIDAAEFISVSPRTLESWRLSGGGPAFVRLGRRVAYSVEDLRRFMADNRVEPLQ